MNFHDFWAQTLPHVLEAAGSILAIFLTFATKAVQDWIQSKHQNELISGAMKLLATLAFQVVGSIQQTVIDDLKVALADNKISPEEYAHALADAKQQAFQTIKNVFTTHFGDLFGENTDNLVNHAIEAEVQSRAVVTANPPSP